MVPDAWLGAASSWLVITNTRFAFGYPMPLLLTPTAVEEYGIDVLFCAYSRRGVGTDRTKRPSKVGVTGTYNDPILENETLKKGAKR